MLRRFETYAFLRGTEQADQERLADVLLRAGHHIPEVLRSAVGWNHSPASSELVWEHFFDSPAAYRRYMVHPYHADLIDRYVLADSPERVVETVRGAGLFGYHCDDAPVYALPVRVVALLDLDPEAGDAVERRLWDDLEEAGTEVGADAIRWGANTLANAWFDGVTPLPGPPPRWSHIWEAGLPAASPTGLDAVLDHAPVRAHRQLLYNVVRLPSRTGAAEGVPLP